MEQITLLPVMDKEMKKRLQQEVVSILKEYRTLKARFNNEVKQQQEGSSLFSEIRNIRHVSNIKFKQIEKALQYVLDYNEAETIKIKYLNGEKLKDSFIYDELLMKKNQLYI